MLDCHWTLKIFWELLIHVDLCSFILHYLCLFHMLGWTLAFLIQNLFYNLNFILLMVLDLLHMFLLIGHPSLPFIITLHHRHLVHIIQHHSLSLGLTCELIDCLILGPVLGYAFADAFLHSIMVLNSVLIHQVQPNIDVPNVPICFILFSDSI